MSEEEPQEEEEQETEQEEEREELDPEEEFDDPMPNESSTSIEVGGMGESVSMESTLAEVIRGQLPDQDDLIQKTYLEEGEPALLASEVVDMEVHDYSDHVVEMEKKWLPILLGARNSVEGRMFDHGVSYMETQGNQASRGETIVLGSLDGKAESEEEEEEEAGSFFGMF